MSRTQPKAAIPYGDVDTDNPLTQIPPATRPLFDCWMRDPNICLGGDGYYYLTGTTRPPEGPRRPGWVWSDGVRLWRSPDLRDWEPLGLVWSLDDGPEWLRNFYVYAPDGTSRRVSPESLRESPPDTASAVRRAFWCPRIHYSKRHQNYFISGSMNFNVGMPSRRWIGDLFGGTFILRSKSGEAGGPYETTTDRPLTHYIDTRIFEDDDSALYFVWQHGNMARLTEPMDALLEVMDPWQKNYDPEPTREGAHLFKANGLYHLVVTMCAWDVDGRATYRHRGHAGDAMVSYDAVVAASKNIYGPYGLRYTSLTGGGHGNHFQDRDGRWWACVFITAEEKAARRHVDFVERPAIVPMRWLDGRIVPDPDVTSLELTRK
jgi:beta-xylosidase